MSYDYVGGSDTISGHHTNLYISSGRGGGYTFLRDSLTNKNGYERHWDKKARAPYLFNPEKKIFITYDDEKSVKEKCKYVQRHHLAGAMFWEYNSDKKEYLLKVIADRFHYGK
jgi:chitinase